VCAFKRDEIQRLAECQMDKINARVPETHRATTQKKWKSLEFLIEQLDRSLANIGRAELLAASNQEGIQMPIAFQLNRI
jgi:hypothetical protein